MKTRTEKREQEKEQHKTQQMHKDIAESDLPTEKTNIPKISPETRRQRALFVALGLGAGVFFLAQYNNRHGTYTIPFVL